MLPVKSNYRTRFPLAESFKFHFFCRLHVLYYCTTIPYIIPLDSNFLISLSVSYVLWGKTCAPLRDIICLLCLKFKNNLPLTVRRSTYYNTEIIAIQLRLWYIKYDINPETLVDNQGSYPEILRRFRWCMHERRHA